MSAAPRRSRAPAATAAPAVPAQVSTDAAAPAASAKPDATTASKKKRTVVETENKKVSASPEATPAKKRTRVSSTEETTEAAVTEAVENADAPSTEGEKGKRPKVNRVELADEILASVNDVIGDVCSTLTQVRRLVNDMSKNLKTEIRSFAKQTKTKKARKLDANGQPLPNTFTIPCKVSPELAAFMGKPAGTLVSRTEANRAIKEYVHEHKLEMGQFINADAKLRKLLNTTDPIGYFTNLQKLLSVHFIKEPKA